MNNKDLQTVTSTVLTIEEYFVIGGQNRISRKTTGEGVNLPQLEQIVNTLTA